MKPVARWARHGLVAAALSGAAAVPAWATEYISQDEWPDIQRGIQVTQYARIAGVVNEFDRAQRSSIVVLHPGGEAGHDWAVEIRDWLVALGVPSGAIALRPGSGRPDAVGLQVERQE